MLKKAPIIHVGIVVETDLEHALYLKNKLAYYYPFNLDAMLIPDITTERIDNKKLDIINKRKYHQPKAVVKGKDGKVISILENNHTKEENSEKEI